MKKLFRLVVLISFTLLVSCNFQLGKIIKGDFVDETTEILIADEVIYGDTFSLQAIYSTNARTVGQEIQNYKKMVYFSVMPTSLEEVYKVTDELGFLNPIEMNRQIIQTCDAESIILKDEAEQSSTENQEINAEELINLDIKYYYIIEKEKADILSTKLQNFEIIEEFSMLDEDETLVTEEVVESAERSVMSRGIFTKYEVCGKVQYKINGKTFAANGIRIDKGFSSLECNTSSSGWFSVGKTRNIWGPVWLWAEYENAACKLTNCLGISASTLLTVRLPSNLNHVTITADSDYANAKMAICNELFTRYNEEKAKYGYIPQAKVWTTQFSNGTSSAPCFHLINVSKSPNVDIHFN